MDSASALSALNSFQPTSSEDLMTQAQTKYGIPDLSNRVKALTGITNNLTNSIAAVDPSVTGRTAGSLVTEGQRSALVNREKQPLLGSLATNNQDLNTARGDLNTNQSFADKLASALASDQTDKYTRLKNQYDISKAAEDTKASQALEQQKLAETVRQANMPSKSGGGGGSTATVNPAQDFLDYIASQFKASGKNPSRQTQDAWANAWFNQNKVSTANRNGYWNLFNTTYKRTSDPTKDYLYQR